MKITLPKRRDGSSPGQISLDTQQCLLIVGANGAGKTRFTVETARGLRRNAYPLSALDGLYRRYDDPEEIHANVRQVFAPSVKTMASRAGLPTLLEYFLNQLMNDELVNLLAFKIANADAPGAKLPPTRLDKVIELWQEVFPDNKVLLANGNILFSRGLGNTQSYSSKRLSDGEKAVLFYAAAVLYAPADSVIFVDAPEIFLHPSITASLWNRLEACRPDCRFCYTTHDTEFASSRNGAPAVWVRDCDPEQSTWDYDILPPGKGLTPELYMTLIGARKPVLFIEGDSERSIDAKLYPLIFPDYNVRSLGSCNKVIEATRTFNDLYAFHKMDSCGIVDRDRRDDAEVAYLRRKRIMVPDVAEIENLLLLDDIVVAMAQSRGCDARRALQKVKRAVMNLFAAELHQQALLHTRHRVKRTMEYRVDSRSNDIGEFENHLHDLLREINAREIYEGFCRDFQRYVRDGDYAAVLRVFNHKAMLPGSNVAQLCGFGNKDQYIDGIIDELRRDTPYARTIRAAVRRCLTGE